MKNVALIMLALIAGAIISTNAFAKEQNQEEEQTQSYDVTGKSAFVFRMGGLFNLSSGYGSILTYKRQVTEKSAFTFGLSGQIRTDVEELSEGFHTNSSRRVTEDYSNINDRSSSPIEEINTYHNWSIGIISHYVRYFNTDDRLKLFGGIGPSILYTKQGSEGESQSEIWEENNNQLQTGIDNRAGKNITNTINVGANMIWGLEWFLNDFISFSGEYGLEVGYGWGTRERENTQIRDMTLEHQETGEIRRDYSESVTESTYDISRYYLNPNLVRVGVAVWFN